MSNSEHTAFHNKERKGYVKSLETKERLSKIKISKLLDGKLNPGGGKLTISDVREIGKLISLGVKNKEIAKIFMVGATAISKIKCKKRWNWLFLYGVNK